MTIGEWPEFVDHINGDRTDNKIENLRSCSRLENSVNRAVASHNKSGVLGVHYDKSRGKWAAEIKVNKKKVYLGRFDSIDEAKTARKIAEVKYGFHPNHGRIKTSA